MELRHKFFIDYRGWIATIVIVILILFSIPFLSSLIYTEQPCPRTACGFMFDTDFVSSPQSRARYGIEECPKCKTPIEDILILWDDLKRYEGAYRNGEITHREYLELRIKMEQSMSNQYPDSFFPPVYEELRVD
jgi:hypothetical protein